LFAQLFGQLGGPRRCGLQRLLDDGFEAAGLERLDRSFGGAGWRGDAAAQFGSVYIAGNGHARSAQSGLQGQLGGGFAGQAEFFAGGGHGLDQQEEVRRAAAGNGGHSVQLLLLIKPQGGAHGRQQLLGLLALCRADLLGGIQAADALAQQRWRVGHAAHHRAWANPALQAGAGDAGGDGNDQLAFLQVGLQGLADVLHDLRLDRQHDHVGTGDCLGVVFEGFDAVLGLDAGAGLGARVAGADLRSLQALGTQAADQAGGHVAGADKGNTCLAHVRSLWERVSKAWNQTGP